MIARPALAESLSKGTSAGAQTNHDTAFHEQASGFATLDRPTGMAEFGLGLLMLPRAQICVERLQAGCERGDNSFEIEAWQLYRANIRLAFGAGITLGLLSSTQAPRMDPQGVERSHRREYLTAEGIARYYPYVGESFEAWGGVAGGLVVVSDRFETKTPYSEKAVIGPRGVTVRTEGYALGLAAGAAMALSESWSLGAAARYSIWFLPSRPATDPLGDEASLTGRNSVIIIGVGVAFRIPL
ncbi:MAG TPA: hypothetical protein VGJ84_16045 [Polyangiaceae bacterium]